MNSNFSIDNEEEVNIIENMYPNVLKIKAHNVTVDNDKTGMNSNYNIYSSNNNNMGNYNENISSCNNNMSNYNDNNNCNSSSNARDFRGYSGVQSTENEEHGCDDFMDIRLSQSGQHKRHHDFYNNKNSFQHYLKKLKTCRIDADELRNILEKRLSYDRDNHVHKTVQEEEKKGMGSESNSSSSNHDGLHLYRKLNLRNKNSRSKSKNKSRKRKRINSKIDKKFIIKCRTCKYINPNGFKMGDYYTCQNCGYNDFSVIRSSSPNNGE
ncbi:conserved Plasmodium protein, unknown function [Plasmodium ovale wallikeri]|uniref:Uncharacterized protein n=1 Tax=Plasmodium ovale wallikeri TaxID=864142 RepID=A0A1A8YTY1_PLAOA|nr:conserved Plasmodium protein, unknown function [Plasmodium ovale wallikeri]